ncbi:trypsin-1-like [Macrobrachium rosenbergii]|uniref:trypsin-1-like n=1 Tax=Macrobrachium rosenbergii TaxID=79674 RepID=UPI0034D594A8
MEGEHWRCIFLLAFGIFCILSTTAQQNGKCSSNGGACVPRKEVQASCQRLAFPCPAGAVCCQAARQISNPGNNGGSPKQVNPKRKCIKRRPCTLQMGICVPVKKNTCTTATDKSLCKGASCTCCLDALDCKQTKKCVKKGGNCRKLSETCGGTADPSLCKGTRCTCCILGPCLCGRSNQPRIVGGQEVTPEHKYPWLTSIYTDSGNTFICGGSLIDDRHILTAAHCLFRDYVYPLSRQEIRVGLADHNRNSTADDIAGVTQMAEIENYVVHEKYNTDTTENDIAIITLKKPISLTADGAIRPVCLPADDSMTYEGDNGIVAGWGYLRPNDNVATNVPYEVTVPIIGPDCKGDFPSSYVITQNNICAGFPQGGKDSCQGDSGGPLVVQEKQIYIQAGIVSFGDGCAEPNKPGIYTRVSKYLDWIKTNTKGAKVCPPNA